MKLNIILLTLTIHYCNADLLGIFDNILSKGTDFASQLSAQVPQTDLTEIMSADPQVNMTTPEMIAYNGYPVETHEVITEDGYKLTVHRIPRGKDTEEIPQKTVLLHHSLLGSSADFVVSGPENGLAYILADNGYDVWLGNVRGNTYSKAHVTKNVHSNEFWNFSWHEMSIYDLPAEIDYIRNKKGDAVELDYIGHSMGNTMLYVLLATKPEYNQKLRAGFALAPIAYMTEVKSPISKIAPFTNNIQVIFKMFGVNELLPQDNPILRLLINTVCRTYFIDQAICRNTLFFFCGFDEKQFNRTLLPNILGHSPAGASTKTIVHYAQEIYNNGKFQQFDNGFDENMKQYGQYTPPQYAIENISLPIALLSAQNDWLSGQADVKNLAKRLPNLIEHYIVPLKEFNHVDFVWAKDAKTLVYEKLLSLMQTDVNTN